MMKLRNAETKNDSNEVERKARFSRFRALAERSARVAAAAFAVTFAFSCGEDTTGRDGGGDGGIAHDGGMDGGGGDSGASSICAQYGAGDPHRHVFSLEGNARIEGSAYFFEFRRIVGTGDNRIAGFIYYPENMATNEGISFKVGERKTMDVPGVGQVIIECCEMTANPCTPSSGDQSCSATLASQRTW